jgi:hypothetical protein
LLEPARRILDKWTPGWQKLPADYVLFDLLSSEKQVYVVECILLKFKRETNDNDYHLIVKDLNSNEKLVVEVPSPLCVDTTNPHLSGIPAIRALLKQELGTITTNYKNAKPGTRIRVTGVGFFDKKNHPTGFKGRELHPVLDLEFL